MRHQRLGSRQPDHAGGDLDSRGVGRRQLITLLHLVEDVVEHDQASGRAPRTLLLGHAFREHHSRVLAGEGNEQGVDAVAERPVLPALDIVGDTDLDAAVDHEVQ